METLKRNYKKIICFILIAVTIIFLYKYIFIRKFVISGQNQINELEVLVGITSLLIILWGGEK